MHSDECTRLFTWRSTRALGLARLFLDLWDADGRAFAKFVEAHQFFSAAILLRHALSYP
jgi:hypothetical protein